MSVCLFTHGPPTKPDPHSPKCLAQVPLQEFFAFLIEAIAKPQLLRSPHLRYARCIPSRPLQPQKRLICFSLPSLFMSAGPSSVTSSTWSSSRPRRASTTTTAGTVPTWSTPTSSSPRPQRRSVGRSFLFLFARAWCSCPPKKNDDGQETLAPALLLLYGDVEHTGHYDKLEHRFHIAAVLKYLWQSPEHRCAND